MQAETHAQMYGDISWATCHNIEAPHSVFYEPLFPDVSRNCASGLCIGVTADSNFLHSDALCALGSPCKEQYNQVASYRAKRSRHLSFARRGDPNPQSEEKSDVKRRQK